MPARRFWLETKPWVALGVLVLAVAWWWSARRPGAAGRRSLAVLSFEQTAPEPSSAWLATALPEMLTTELAAGGDLRLIPGEIVTRMRLEAADQADQAVPEPVGAGIRIAQLVEADFAVHGSYQVVQQDRLRELRLGLLLSRTRTGETVASLERSGTEAQLFALVSEVAAELRRLLGIRKLSFAQQKAVRAALPISPETFRFYVDGLDKLRRFDALAALESLTRALALDPSYPLAHAALSETWSALGYDLKAQDSAARAYELAPGLPAEEYQRIEARYFEAAAEWPRVIKIYQELWRQFPDSVAYGLRLAEAQIVSGKGQDALATVAELRALPAPTRRDPGIDLAESAATSSLGDYRRQKSAAKQAIEKGRSRGASILVANAHRWLGEAHYQLHEFEQARQAFEESERLFEAAGDRRSVAEVLSWLADIRYSQGDSTAAVDLYHEALAIHRVTGNRKGVSETENGLGYQLYLRGDLAAARAMLEEAVAIGREIGDRYSEANSLDSLIEVLLRQGDLEAAEELALQERTIYRELGNRPGSVWSHHHLGRIALAAGDVPRAQELHDKALVISDQIGDPYWTAFILDALANDLLAAGDLIGARRMSADARSMRRELGGEVTLAASRTTGAEILLELERPGEAEALARQAVAVFAGSVRPDDEVAAAAILARILVAQGEPAPARAALADARRGAEATQNPSVRLAVAMAEAELLAAGGSSDEAAAGLAAIASEAHRLGLIKLELEARLAWGRLELAAGGDLRAAGVAAGRQRLEALARKASDLGLGLIARKAESALATAGNLADRAPGSIRITDVW